MAWTKPVLTACLALSALPVLAGCSARQLEAAGERWGQSLCSEGKATCTCPDGTIAPPSGYCQPPLRGDLPYASTD